MTTPPPPRPELLAPAGDPARLDAAITYRAHAVYLGGAALNLRAGSTGFTWDTLPPALAKARAHGVRVYYTLNALPRDAHLPAVEDALERLAAMGSNGPDALIIADPGVLRLAQRLAPRLPIHLSTQANTANAEAARFWADQGVARVNLAREMDAPAIRALRHALPGLELEIFVHGAMCMAVSGRCLLSAWLNQRSANLGACTHPCRFDYRPDPTAHAMPDAMAQPAPTTGDRANDGGAAADDGGGAFTDAAGLFLEERTRPGEAAWELRESEGFSHILAADDLCLVRHLAWFVRQGVAGIKIEGRTKSPGYVAQVVDVYRTALDDLAAKTFRPADYVWELRNAATRRLSTGFFLPHGRRCHVDPLPDAEKTPLVAFVRERLADDAWRVAVRGRWDAGQAVCVMQPGLRRPVLAPGGYALENADGDRLALAHPGVEAILRTPHPALRPGLFIRKD
ncbi:MAG: peptidase U32 family protein [Desulfovibrionaceae bacterium]